jgi:hypothetical protein
MTQAIQRDFFLVTIVTLQRHITHGVEFPLVVFTTL